MGGTIFVSSLILIIWFYGPLKRIAAALESVAGELKAIRDIAERRRP